ncbi:MAG: sigma-70 family RNA polymerase sigma factor [Bacteroidetes bacterium]|nr:sigma-70 family RNA polymerase sigma factor [Bacteroidota bacterium]
MEEHGLLEKLRLGDKAAFNELVKLYSNRVINTCYRFLLDKEDAEDISQEVFIEVFQSVRSFRGDAKLSTWIYRIAVTRSLDEIKKRKRKKRISSLSKVFHIDEVGHWITGGVMPDRSIGEKEKMNEIRQALNTLPDSQRVVFTLSKIEGYTNGEIAEIMNTTTVAVESLLYRARKKVSNELEKILKN